MNRWLWVALWSAVALWVRTASRYAEVFGTPGLVNFTETDAWFHVRTMEHMVRNFPHRLRLDRYTRALDGQSVDTGAFFDWPVAVVGWLLHLSPAAVDVVAAWYPVLLGTMLVPVTFLAARASMSERAAWWATAAVAVMPGHFLDTGSLGFPDHHVMEALLTALLLWLLARGNTPGWVLGAVLASYLLTFAPGAFVVAMVTVWYWVRVGLRPGADPDSRRFALACALALPFALWWRDVYLMRYSVAALGLAAVGLFVLPAFSRWCQRWRQPRVVFAGATVLALAVVLGVLSVLPMGAENVWAVLRRMVSTGPVAELQSLTDVGGRFSLQGPWEQFGGAFVLTVIALPWLGWVTWREQRPQQTLLLIWSTVFFVMAMRQVRMTYYFGVAAALLSGFVMNRFRLRPLSWQTVGVLLLGGVLMGPNLIRATESQQRLAGSIPPEWYEALVHLRDRTPEPFGDPAAFWGMPQRPPTYSVLAWWDYGYWLSGYAHRVPVANPTQANAGLAADFFLATQPEAAHEILAQMRSQYVVVNEALPFLSDGAQLRGRFLGLFPYTRSHLTSDYVWTVQEPEGPSILFRADYFRSMLFRLYFAGGQASPASEIGNFALIRLDRERVVHKQVFSRLSEARAAVRTCLGCELVSENPATPMVDVEPVGFVEPEFASSQTALEWRGQRRAKVQVYRVRENLISGRATRGQGSAEILRDAAGVIVE